MPRRKPARARILRRKPAKHKSLIEIPPILLEGDRPSPPTETGPGEKFVLAPTPPAQHLEAEPAELPEAYGTGRLFVMARDPHWLYAHWDFTRAQQSRLNAQSADGHLVLRIHPGDSRNPAVSENHVHPESRHWFAHVAAAATTYVAELGYYRPNRKWTSVTFSEATLTPPDSVSADTSVTFATIPIEMSYAQLLALVREAAREYLPLALAIEELREHGHPDLPRLPQAALDWTPEQERALSKIVQLDPARRVWIGSLEITELICGRREPEPFSPGATSSGFNLFGGEPDLDPPAGGA